MVSKIIPSFIKDRKKNTNKKTDKKPLDAMSKFFIVVTLTIVGLLIYIAYGLTVSEENFKGQEYYDENLNMSLIIPQEWNIATPDEEFIKKAVFESTGGISFDMNMNSLQEEVVPLALAVKGKEGDKIFKKFMTLAYRGSDSKYSYLKDKVKLMDDFKLLLKKLEHKDIKVDEVKDIEKNNMAGILLKGSGVLEGKKVYYYQYFETAGANTLTITYGTTEKKNKAIEDINNVLAGLFYHKGGEYLPTPIKDEIREEALKKHEESKKDEVEVKVEQSTKEGNIEVKDDKGKEVKVEDQGSEKEDNDHDH